MEKTLWQKWHRHRKDGGLLYAFYRGLKYTAWRIKKSKIDRQKIRIKWKREH
jgi:hypothetical protein